MQPLQVLRLTVYAGLQRHALRSSLSISSRSFHVSNKLKMPIEVGSSVPNVDLYESSPADKVNILDLCKDKNVVMFGVPGAFTPGCSKTHLPGYIQDADKIKARGIDEIVCVSVNDAFVMNAWAEANGTKGKLRLLADPSGEFTKKMGLDQNLPPLGGLRSKRFSAIVEKGVVKTLNVEPDGTGLSCSLSSNLKI